MPRLDVTHRNVTRWKNSRSHYFRGEARQNKEIEEIPRAMVRASWPAGGAALFAGRLQNRSEGWTAPVSNSMRIVIKDAKMRLNRIVSRD